MYFYRGLGPWGPGIVQRYTTARFGSYSNGNILTEEESKLLTGSVRSVFRCVVMRIFMRSYGFFFHLKIMRTIP